MPFVSVIIPTYNRRQFVCDAIDSVLNQTYKDYEILVVDDASADETYEFLKEKYKDKIILIRNKENRGVSFSRNIGMKNSKGEYICFLDSDDIWKKNKLAQQIEFFKNHPDSVVNQTEEIWLKDGKFKNQKKKHAKPNGECFTKILSICLVCASAVIIKREIFNEVGLFDESLEVCEDFELWLRIGAKYPIHLLPEALTIKRSGHSDQLSAKFWGMDRFRVIGLEKISKNQLLTTEMKQAVFKELIKKYKILKNGSLKRSKKKDADLYSSKLQDFENKLVDLQKAEHHC